MRTATLILIGLALSSTAEAGQQTANPLSSRVVERTGVSAGVLPWRHVENTSRAGDRETTTESEQVPDLNGRMAPLRETVIEVIKAGRVVRTNSASFGPGVSGERQLLETRESIEESSANGGAHATDTTWRTDLNGRLAITQRVTEDTSVTPDSRRIEITVHRTDLDGQLRPRERTEHTERQIAPQAVEATTTELQADVNNRWQVIEIRNHDVRTIGMTEQVEETIRQRDVNGALSEHQRTVSRLTTQNGREDLLVETFTDDGRYPSRSSIRPALSGRVHRTTIPRADGGRQIVEEVEARSPVAPGEPLRVVRRLVETTRRTGSGRWGTERQIFERDPNDRLVLSFTETEDTTER